jgi:hypothetical protein
VHGLRWLFPDHEDESSQHVTLRQGQVVLIQDYLDRARPSSAARPTTPP